MSYFKIKNLKFKIIKRLFITILALIVIGVPLLYLTILNSPTVSAAWYDDNWNYRKAVTVTVTSSTGDITNLQTLLTVDTTGITANLQTNCEDLRFTNANGKLLPYYIDTCSDNSATNKVWVLADLVPKNTTTYTMFMYYGNPSAAAASDSAKFTLYNGLVGYWPMNESSWNGTSGEVKDYSKSGNNGTGQGSVTATTGKYSNSGSFDGSSTKYISIADGTLLDLDTSTSEITLSAWIKTSAADASIFGMRNTGDGGNAVIDLELGTTGAGNIGTGKPAILVRDSGNSGLGQAIGSTAINDNTWHHVVATRNSSKVLKIYVDGVEAGSGSDSMVNATTINDARIGDEALNGGILNMNGLIDDARVYNRALSASEVSQLYNATDTIMTTGTGISNPSTSFATEEKAPGPVAYWKFDDGTGTNANDSTTNNNDGTISGATWQTEDQCITGKCLSFDGSNDVVTVSNTVSGIQTVSLWIKPITTSEQIIDINGTASISVSSGTISATSFTSPTIYVNGVVSSTLVANTWQYVTVTTGTALSGSAIKIGQISTNYGQAFIDDVKLYPYARTASQIQTDYASRGSVKGTSAALSASTSNNTTLSNGLVGYWKMDESSGNLTDSSGNGLTGTVTGTTVAAGKFGNGRSFNGSSDNSDMSNNSTFDITSKITVSAWINPTNVAQNGGIISKWTTGGGTNNSYILLLGQDAANNKFGFYIAQSDGTYKALLSTSTLTAGVWTHIVGVADGSKLHLYKNGVEEPTTTAYDGTIKVTTKKVVAGKIREEDAIYSYTGSIDELRVYNRGLTTAEVTSLYNFAPGPRVHLKMDEGSGTSANDSSGNARTGTINGNPVWAPGKYGGGVKMDGTGDDIQVSDF